MNELQHEKSPYLLQHAGNPVSRRTWGQSAFDAAVREDKPIFLSVGYSTCHWCHVMAHESFEDEAVAEAIHRGFIPIKLDREERPDVDAVYMAACLAMNGSGGWPLTVLLTPDRKSFWAGTHLPKSQLLSLLEELWPTAKLVCTAQELPGELFAFLRREARPNLTVLVKTPENEQKLAEIAPFTANYPIPASGVRYYLCRGGACQSPVDSIEALERQMGRLA